jgi:hypothetical protein
MPIFSEIEEGRAEASIVKNETSDIQTKIFLNFQTHKYFKIYFLKIMEELFQSTIFKIFF